jgi:hypothetical protein
MFQLPCFLVPKIEKHNAMVDVIECLCEKERAPEIEKEIEIYGLNASICDFESGKLKIRYVQFSTFIKLHTESHI